MLHICFGYAHIVCITGRLGYSFLAELNDCAATQISIEAAQPRLDCSALAGLPDKTIVLGVLDLGDEKVETPQVVAQRIQAALDHVPAARLVIAPDCGMKYRRVSVAFRKLQAMVAGTQLVRGPRALRVRTWRVRWEPWWQTTDLRPFPAPPPRAAATSWARPAPAHLPLTTSTSNRPMSTGWRGLQPQRARPACWFRATEAAA